eukprot:c19355_g1_i1 orf=182-880(-)
MAQSLQVRAIYTGTPPWTRSATCSVSKEGDRRSSPASTSRRSLVILTHTLMLGSPFHLASAAPELLYVADGKPKYFTNLEEAREEGERRREQKELAEGPIISLPSGVKFRELSQGSGDAVSLGQLCSICYTIYKLNGFYLDSLGYGKEGKNDVGDTLTFQYGGGQVPRAIELGMGGMQAGGKRRILVRPELGWISPKLLPLPTSSAAERRLNNNKRQPLLFEVELVKLRPAP